MLFALFLSAPCVFASPDAITIGNASAPQGGNAWVPVYVRDAKGTTLGVENPAKIRGFQFTVRFDPVTVSGCTSNSQECDVGFVPSGVLRDLKPTSSTLLTTGDTVVVRYRYGVAIPFTSDPPLPGELIGFLRFKLASTQTDIVTIALKLDGSSEATSLFDEQLTETVAAGSLEVFDGELTLRSSAIACTEPPPSSTSFGWSGPMSGCMSQSQSCAVGEAIRFAVSNSQLSTCDVVRFSFGDQTVATGTVVEHAYTAPNEYSVNMLLLNPFGAVSVKQLVRVGVVPIPCTPKCGATVPSQGSVGVPVSFAATFNDCPGVGGAFQWTFGDGSSVFGANTTHSYTTPGTYTWALFGTTTAGGNCTTSGTVTISSGQQTGGRRRRSVGP